MGVILDELTLVLQASRVVSPLWGGYSQKDAVDLLAAKVVSSLWGLFLLLVVQRFIVFELFPCYGGYSFWSSVVLSFFSRFPMFFDFISDYGIILSVRSNPLHNILIRLVCVELVFVCALSNKQTPIFKLQNSFLFCCHYPMVKPFFI